MIYDLMERAKRYKGIDRRLDAALDLVSNTDFAALSLGRYDLNADVFYTVMDCDLLPWEQTRWERHKKYIDIQIVFGDMEKIAVWPVDRLNGWDTYSEERDVCFTDDDTQGAILPMRSDSFAVFFPEDAHRTCWAAGKEKTARKVVIKIPV